MTTPNPTIDWHARARGLNLQTRPFIGGRFDDAPAEHAFDCVSPIDGKRIASLAEVGVRGVDAAVTAARKAFDAGSWANMAPRARKKVMLKLAALVDQHREELALLDTLCMGMPISISNGYCVPWLINALEWYGEAIDKLYDEVAPTDKSVLAIDLEGAHGCRRCRAALELADGPAGLEDSAGARGRQQRRPEAR